MKIYLNKAFCDYFFKCKKLPCVKISIFDWVIFQLNVLTCVDQTRDVNQIKLQNTTPLQRVFTRTRLLYFHAFLEKWNWFVSRLSHTMIYINFNNSIVYLLLFQPGRSPNDRTNSDSEFEGSGAENSEDSPSDDMPVLSKLDAINTITCANYLSLLCICIKQTNQIWMFRIWRVLCWRLPNMLLEEELPCPHNKRCQPLTGCLL